MSECVFACGCVCEGIFLCVIAFVCVCLCFFCASDWMFVCESECE